MEQGEEIAVACVGSIVKSAMDKLTEHYIQQLAMSRTAKQAIDYVMQAIEWQLLVHDDGEKLTLRKVLADKATNPDSEPDSSDAAASADTQHDEDLPTARPESPSPINEPDNRTRPTMDIIASKLSLPATYNQIWTCEEEPAPADLDRWARGVIPTKATVAAPLSSFGMTGGLNSTGGGFTVVHESDEGSATPRSGASSVTPTPSRAGHFRSPTRGGSAGSTAGQAALNSTHRKTRSIVEEKESVQSRPPQPFALEITLSKEAIAKEKSRESDLRRLEKKKKAESDVARVRAADAAEKDRLDRIQSDLRHRSYTFDSRGNVILIAPVTVDKFPPFQATPKVQVKNEYLTDEQEEEIRKREKRNRFKKATTIGAGSATGQVTAVDKNATAPTPLVSSSAKSSAIGLPKKKSPKKSLDTSVFLDETGTQPSLLSTLTLTKGVTLKQGALSKTFDPRNPPPSMSAAGAYAQSEGVVDNQAAELRGLTRKEYLKKLQSRADSDAKVTHAQLNQTAATNIGVNHPSILSPNRPTSGARPTNQTAPIVDDDHAPDDDDMEWSSDRDDDARPHPRSSATGVVASDVDGRSSYQPTASDLFNVALTLDPSWGQNPATLGSASLASRHQPHAPHRPNQIDREAALGRRNKNPRDRAGDLATSQPLTRQHLPPAPFGKTTGHGMPVAGDPHDTQHTHIPTTTAFVKLPTPTNIVATDKARLYFKPQ